MLLISLLLCGIMLSISGAKETEDRAQETTKQRLPHGCNTSRSHGNALFPLLTCTGDQHGRFQFNFTNAEEVKAVSLEYKNISQLHVDDFHVFTNLFKISVKSNHIERFVGSSAHLKLSSVRHVFLEYNKLKHVPNKALKSFPNLVTLHLSGNLISHLSKDDFKFNPKLQKLHLDSNPIETFEEEWLAELQLIDLDLRRCQLNAIPQNIATQINLVYAGLSYNKIFDVPNDSFAKCSNLRHVELQSNRIKKLNEHSFRGADRLRVIDLSENDIQLLGRSTFEDLKSADLQINLLENPILCNIFLQSFKTWLDNLRSHDPSSEVRFKCENPKGNRGTLYHQLTKEDLLCTLPYHKNCKRSEKKKAPKVNKELQKHCGDVCFCYDENGELYHHPDGHFSERIPLVGSLYSRHLTYPSFECEKTDLKQIPTNIREDIKMIHIEKDNIGSLLVHDLVKYKELETISLIRNGITKISETNDELPSVTAVFLHHNDIIAINKKHFASFPQLKSLSLQRNKLIEIPNDAFENNKVLTNLDISSNPLKNFNGDFLKMLPLKTLSLRQLSIKDVPEVLKKLMSLTFVDLRENLIETLLAGAFSNCNNLKTVYLENNLISRIDAGTFSGASSLGVIKLSHNKISTIAQNTFAEISQARLNIDLWSNPIACDCSIKPFMRWVEKWEFMDPTTEINFRCHQPLRLHGKLSQEISAKNDLKCDEDDEEKFVKSDVQGNSHSSSGRIALAVILSIVFTGLACLAVWKCSRKRTGDELQYFAQME